MITRLRTNFEVGDIPLAEYPRPQFQRDSYFTLNGSWDYAIYRASEEFAGVQTCHQGRQERVPVQRLLLSDP